MKKIVIAALLFKSMLCAQGPASKVAIASVTQGSLFQEQEFSGTVSFNQQSRIAAQSDGAVVKVHFDRAQKVKKGSLLLEIDSQILEAKIEAVQSQLKEAELKLEQAKIDFKRYEALFKKESIAKQKFDVVYYQKEQATQNLLLLKAQLKAEMIAWKKKHLYAPFDGMIVSRSVSEGEWVKEGAVVAVLVNPSKLDLLFHLPAEYLGSIKAASRVPVMINGKSYEATVAGRLLGGDATTRTFPLLLNLQNSQSAFFEGMQVSVALKKRLGKESLLVPRDAIVRHYEKTSVYVVLGDQAESVAVTVLGFDGDKAAVLGEKLKAGMKVVTKGNERLYPGAKVEIQ